MNQSWSEEIKEAQGYILEKNTWCPYRLMLHSELTVSLRYIVYTATSMRFSFKTISNASYRGLCSGESEAIRRPLHKYRAELLWEVSAWPDFRQAVPRLCWMGASDKDVIEALQAMGQTYGRLRTIFDDYVGNPDRLMHHYQMDDMDKLIREIQTTYLNPTRSQPEGLNRLRTISFERHPELEQRLTEQFLLGLSQLCCVAL